MEENLTDFEVMSVCGCGHLNEDHEGQGLSEGVYNLFFADERPCVLPNCDCDDFHREEDL